MEISWYINSTPTCHHALHTPAIDFIVRMASHHGEFGPASNDESVRKEGAMARMKIMRSSSLGGCLKIALPSLMLSINFKCLEVVAYIGSCHQINFATSNIVPIHHLPSRFLGHLGG